MYVCNCKGVTESEYRELRDLGCTFEVIAHVMPLTGACCKCLPQIKEIFKPTDQSVK